MKLYVIDGYKITAQNKIEAGKKFAKQYRGWNYATVRALGGGWYKIAQADWGSSILPIVEVE